jgi:serine/threonine protein kinase
MDRYRVEEKLGDGTFGTVFRAVHHTTQQEVSEILEI